MQKLIDMLTFSTGRTDSGKSDAEDRRLRPEERDAALLSDKYPQTGADIENLSEYRLASLLQFPHH